MPVVSTATPKERSVIYSIIASLGKKVHLTITELWESLHIESSVDPERNVMLGGMLIFSAKILAAKAVPADNILVDAATWVVVCLTQVR